MKRLLLILWGVANLSSLQAVCAQNIDYVASTLWSGANDVAIAGNYAFCAFTMGMMALDVSDPSAIEFISQTSIHGNGQGIAVEGNYAYLADGTSGMQIVNVSDATNPVHIGGYDTPGNAVDICISSNYAYLACGNSVQILDISDPLNPTFAGSFSTLDSSVSIYVSGNFVYVANYLGSLQIVDISDPHNPAYAGNHDTQYVANGVCVRGDYAFVALGACGPENCWGGIEIINVSDPHSPFSVGFYGGDAATGILISGSYAFISWHFLYHGGIEIVDISDPSDPSSVGIYHGENYPHGIFVFGDLASVVWSAEYFYDSGSLETIDISDPGQPVHLGSYNTVSLVTDVFVSDSYAYATWNDRDGTGHYKAGLELVDVSDPYSPVSIGNCDTAGFSQDVFASNNYAYVDNASGFWVVDVSDPQNPAYCGRFETYNTGAIFVSGIYAYVAAGDSGLYIVDVSNPLEPIPVGRYQSANTTICVAVRGDYAYVGWGECYEGDPGYCIGGLKILDVSNADNPVLAGSLEIPHGRCLYIFVSGDFAYVAARDGLQEKGLQIVDISDPGNPVPAGFYPTPNTSWAPSVHVSGNYAYLALDGFGLEVVDVTDPYGPALAGSYESARRGVYDVFVSNGYTYLAERNGLTILRFNPQTAIEEPESMPARFALEQNYPNPFNASTSMGYSLPETGEVTIGIYDLLGRKVQELFRAKQTAGEHQVVWDAGDFASGVYFACLQAGSRSESIRMTLLK